MCERHSDHTRVTYNQNMFARVSVQDALDAGCDACQKNIQWLSAGRSRVDRIVFETGQRARSLALNLGGGFAFPNAESYFLESRFHREWQAVLGRKCFGESATAH